MKAWHVEKSNGVNLVEETVPRKDDEVKLKLSRVAVTAHDLVHFATEGDGRPVIPAHSAVAYVSEELDDGNWKLGSRVAVSPFISEKKHGVDSVLTMGIDTDGLLRDFVTVPSENVFQLPDGISDEQAVFADHIAMGNKVFGSLACEQGDYVVIVGAGTLGLILCQLASYYQMVPVLVDLDADRLALARKWDLLYTLNPTFDNLERRVEEITGGRMCEAAIYAGEGMGLNAALRLIKDKGEVIIAGYSFYSKHQVDMETILKKQLILKGICNGYGEFPSAINLLANKIVRTDGLISAERYFEDVPEIVDECVKYPLKYTNIIITID